MNWFELIIGAILGIIFTELYERLIKRLFIKIKVKFLKRIYFNVYNDAKVKKYINNYYTHNGHFEDLYECEINGFSKTILFLTNESCSNMDLSIYDNPYILNYINSDNIEYKTNNRIIKQRKQIGQLLFNEKSLVFSKCNYNSLFKIDVKECYFFQKLSLIDKIEKETFFSSKCIIKRKKLRNEIIKSFDQAIKPKSYPISIGCHVIIAITINKDIFFLLEERSPKTFTYGGKIASIPVFGLVPIPQTKIDSVDLGEELSKNILLYNILKEYCEELFNVTELENDIKPNPFWFFEEIEPAKQIIDALITKKANCILTGFGFDAINSLSILSSLIYIKDEELSKEIYNKCSSNWEIKNKIKFVNIKSNELSDWLKNDSYQNGTAFAISLAIKTINEKWRKQ